LPTVSLNTFTDDDTTTEHHDILNNFDITTAQQQCADCANMIRYLRDGSLPTDDTLARKIGIQADNYVYQDQILYHWHTSRRKRLHEVDPVVKQLVIPASLREHILKSYHDNNCHIGMDKVYETLRNTFYWPNMYADVHAWVKTCTAWQICKSGMRNKAPLRSLQIEASIFERWHLVHIALPTVNDYKYVLVAVDSFSLFSVLMPAKRTSAQETATLLYDNILVVYGCRSQ